MSDENLEQNVSEEQDGVEENVEDVAEGSEGYDDNGQPWPMSFTKYDDYIKSENQNKKSKIGPVHIIVFAVVMIVFLTFLFIGFNMFMAKAKAIKNKPAKSSNSVSFDRPTYIPTGKFIDQWNPIDWYTLERNPLTYKSFGDEILDEIYLYSDYISGKEKLDFKADQLFWDVNYTLIKKVFLGTVSEIDIKHSVEREINRFFKEIGVKDFKSDVSDCNIEVGFLKSIISKYEPKIKEGFDKKKILPQRLYHLMS